MPRAEAETNCQGLRCTMPNNTDDSTKAAPGLNRRKNARSIKPRNITSSVTGATSTSRKSDDQTCSDTEDISLNMRRIRSGVGRMIRIRLSTSESRIIAPALATITLPMANLETRRKANTSDIAGRPISQPIVTTSAQALKLTVPSTAGCQISRSLKTASTMANGMMKTICSATKVTQSRTACQNPGYSLLRFMLSW